MLKYSFKRLASSLVTLVIIITVVFVLLRQMPIEGYFDNFDKLDQAQIDAKLTQLGLNKPIHEQLLDFFSNLFVLEWVEDPASVRYEVQAELGRYAPAQGEEGFVPVNALAASAAAYGGIDRPVRVADTYLRFRVDLGTSSRYSAGASITGIIAKKAPISIAFGVASMALSLLMGIPLGAAMARSKGKFWDKIGTMYIVFINAVPAAVYYIFLQIYGTIALNPAVLCGLVGLLLAAVFFGIFHFASPVLRKLGLNAHAVNAIRMGVSALLNVGVFLVYRALCGTTGLWVPVIFAAVYFAVLYVLSVLFECGKLHSPLEKRSWFGRIDPALVWLLPAVMTFVFLQVFCVDAKPVNMLFDPKDPLTWILPVFSMSLGSTASYAMWLRRYMVDEMNKDYVRLARAKGVPEKKIMMRHVFRNAFVPMIQYIPTSLLYTISGSIYIESLYSIPGMGGLLVDVITRQDNPMVQAIVMIYSCIGIVGLLLGDLLMGVIDPRISFVKKEGAR